jgi:hypothetical protein
MAPVGAAGVVALAETTSGRESWRWRVFSIGAVIGLAFGFVYVGIPAISGTLLLAPIQPIDITWTDLTSSTESILPAPMGISFDLATTFSWIPFTMCGESSVILMMITT